MKRSWFLILVALAVVLGYSTADARVNWRNYYTWEVVFKATDGTERTKLSIGASERATDGYDAVYEVDEYRAGSFRAYFYHPEWGRGSIADGTDYYWSDIRSENLPQTWDLTVQANRTGRNVTLNWNLAHLENDGCSTIDLTLVDTQGGNSVDMTGGGANSYEYYNGSTAPRLFTITASGGVGTSGEAPIGLRSSPGGGQIVLHWDDDDAEADGFRVYRDGTLVSGPSLVTDIDADGTVAYVDKTAVKSSGKEAGPATYVYTVTSVAEGGCESEAAAVEVAR